MCFIQSKSDSLSNLDVKEPNLCRLQFRDNVAGIAIAGLYEFKKWKNNDGHQKRTFSGKDVKFHDGKIFN